MLLLLVLACACPELSWDTGAPGCGDGVLDAGEECDEGAANSDSTPDACRVDCRLPWCGDGVPDDGEGCDDGSAWGGDGCTPACTVEDGQLEGEPNDEPASADAWEGGTVDGALTECDTDCFAFALAACSAVSAKLAEPCPAPATLALHDPAGAAVAVGTPDDAGCAVLDPARAPGARFVEEGTWSLCVSGLLGGAVPWYALEVEVVDPEDASFTIDEADDPDGDGRPDRCDDDRDGDGVTDEVDNCPDVPNGGVPWPLAPTADGFLRHWLATGPFTGTSSTESCRPSDDDLVAEDDALVTPALGDAAGDNTWVVLWSADERVDFMHYASVAAPREVYQALYLYSATERTLTLGLGPDDGARVWLNQVEVMDVSGCQGTVIDYFTEEVTLLAGWNSLVVKVRDQGGAWGNYVRFLDGEDPVTDLEVSLDPEGPWVPTQQDTDGDGEGDVCDATPTGR